MKKSFVIVIIITGILTFALVPVVAIGQVVRNNAIGEENARNFAYVDAGIHPEKAESVKTKLDYKNGSFAYDIEFFSDNVEYEYLVKSSNGAILAKDVKYPNQSIQSETASYTDVENSMKTEVISLDRAKEIALSKAGLASDQVVFKKVALEKDDGILVYDIEFYVKNAMSYEFEIDAFSGVILEEKNEVWQTADNKVHDHSTNTGVNTGLELIGPDRAKEMALSKAGLTSDQAVFKKVALEKDGETLVYDIEFYVKNVMSYEFEIDAYSGAILEEKNEVWQTADNKVHDHSTNTGVNTGLELIGPDRAKEIALSKAGLDSDTVVFNKVKLEYDDGSRIYDIEFFIRGEYEYEFEIDAYTGAIIEEETERWEEDD